MEQKLCQSCGMPLTEEILGSNADASRNEDYCSYCYKDGKFLQDCTMDEMIEHCAQFVGEVGQSLPQPITREEYIGQMKMCFPHMKRWRKELTIHEAAPENPALAGDPNNSALKFTATDSRFYSDFQPRNFIIE